MKFRTIILPHKFPFQISYHDNIFLVGSCFSDHVGAFLAANRFHVLSNPFGALFNPVSIANVIKMTIDPKLYTEAYRYFFQNRWVSFAHHGSFSHHDETKFLKQIDKQWTISKSFLEKTNFLFITFGTAFCYRFLERGIVVANCHKIPNAQFEKFRLKIEEIVSMYQEIVQKILILNPAVRIFFTVSPVRHLGDGFHENQLSKSVLHLAIEQLTDNKNIFYFPAFEILMDDLRDYRFYAEDLCHAGENAVRYIEEVFADTFFSHEVKEKQKEIEKENKLLNHRKLK
jgi:hypothetical protein